MKTFTIFLCFLGLHISQVSGEENSTKVYYVVLTAEESAIENITRLLGDFKEDVIDNHNKSIKVQVQDLELTTVCKITGNRSRCKCKSEHIWSAQVCYSDTTCCESAECNFSGKPPPMCLPKNRVTIKGTVNVFDEEYYDSLADSKSERFRELKEKWENKMKEVYSTFKNFNSLEIVNFRRGSVIAEYEFSLNSRITTADLSEKTSRLQGKINGKFAYETTGFVKIETPSSVPYKNSTQIICKPVEEMQPNAEWTLKKEDERFKGEVFDIRNGYEATVTSDSQQSSVSIKSATEIWTGQYTCAFLPISSNFSIVHKASAKLDVVLLPHIYIMSDPQFPHCREKSTEYVAITVSCEIPSKENYTMTWQSQGNSSAIEQQQKDENGQTIYTASTTVGCHLEKTVNLACTFKNRLDQNKSATINIFVIYAHSNYCRAEGEWPNSKSGFSARLKCPKKGDAGERLRKCSDDAKWEDEITTCVNSDLHSLLEDADNLAKGLGSVNKKAQEIFQRLNNSTYESEIINSYANVNTSISVLSQMKVLNQTLKQSVLNDFISSSSNILNVPNESWKTQIDNEPNASLAERYLESVEGLIKLIDIRDNVQINSTNIDVMSCSHSNCKNTVLNITVSMKNPSSGVVKTAGFRNLVKLLPNYGQESDPVSFVVSTTFQSNKSSSGVVIDFPLINGRPRNHDMQCVYWDPASSQWSPDVCQWGGPEKETRCECNHLSSFTILMSKRPQHVKFAEEITYTGLAVSIVSLILCLGIELLAWNAICTTTVSRLRHTAHIHISLSLLLAYVIFLASSFPKSITENWCQVCTVLKHFFFLCAFFWMLCLSVTLLHQVVFLFHALSKRYLLLSYVLGYVCPLAIVAITFISYNSGAKGQYYNIETCWLVYHEMMEGSIHAFLLPIGIIVAINMIIMGVVIMKLMVPQQVTAGKTVNDRQSARNVMRTIILLTPVFGVTWIFGFAVLAVDLTYGPIAFIINYVFTIMHAFQGLFIFFATCVADRQVRDALMKYFKTPEPPSKMYSSDSTTKK